MFVLIRVNDWYVIERRTKVDLTKHCPVYGGSHSECRDKARELNKNFEEKTKNAEECY